MIAYADKIPIGCIRYKQDDLRGDIYIALLKKYHNKGIGTKMLKLLIKKKPIRITSNIHIRNRSSIRTFEKAGFKLYGYVMVKDKKVLG